MGAHIITMTPHSHEKQSPTLLEEGLGGGCVVKHLASIKLKYFFVAYR